ncbi:DUF2845 domain-containing protein [Ectopseudomonas composti]|jgi:hypothetical protein|uniref:DUF2845 domain-containing protein n=1 Tax=Ectopseudomonas composti TaxID=658457 RepID=A0ABN0SCA6_9GAMM|nr:MULTISPECIES: DUF2845 domain-containing protein [Pseudomonas]EZH80586.1 hypothetical protein AU05_12855 [Pseudomonas composti]MDN5516174.1 DUF2845 domain-containing protein [Pseudomonas sp.]QNH07754.1 DUF2845 domain-containing protein [Pseudomonas sp. B11D7D]
MHKFRYLLPLLCLPLIAEASSTYRCGSALVSTTAPTAEVQSKCGEPSSRDFLGYKEVVDRYGFRNEVSVEEWVYGPKSGMYHFLRFEGGRLTEIRSKRGS